jgi:hypothetical protein
MTCGSTPVTLPRPAHRLDRITGKTVPTGGVHCRSTAILAREYFDVR